MDLFNKQEVINIYNSSKEELNRSNTSNKININSSYESIYLSKRILQKFGNNVRMGIDITTSKESADIVVYYFTPKEYYSGEEIMEYIDDCKRGNVRVLTEKELEELFTDKSTTLDDLFKEF